MIKYLLTVTAALALCLIVLYMAIHIPTFNMATYTTHFDEHNTADLINISEAELIAVTRRLVGYMAGTYDDLIIYATVGGYYRPFFTQREIDHMRDVLLLFRVGRLVLGLCIVSFLVILFWAYKNRYLRLLAKVQFFFGTGVALLGVWLIWLFHRDFVLYFHIFHDIFFFFDHERLWMLDPREDMLINMVPYIFFINIGRTVAVIFFSIIAVITTLAGMIFFCKREI